jgi:pyruvate dehydrogenase E1 component
VTSWSELARDGALHRKRELLGEASNEIPFLQLQLEQSAGPIIAATDYVRAVPESVREYVPTDRRYLTLGTDGFGRSDTRGALREYFGVDAASIVRAAKHSLD